MRKGRSSYSFQLNCDTNQVNQLVQSYMSSNGFKPETKKGETYYKSGDGIKGYTYFNYNLNGNNLTIYAWLKGAFGEIGIEQDGLTSINMLIMNYRNSLSMLFSEIEKLNTQNSNGGNNMNNNINNNITGYDPNTGQPIYGDNQNNIVNNNPQNNVLNNTQNANNQFTQTFQNENIKKQEKMCEVGFWLSIIGLLMSLFGISYGIIIYIMNFYFASQGLKTSKKGKAIATIVLSIISIVITLFWIIISALLVA